MNYNITDKLIHNIFIIYKDISETINFNKLKIVNYF